MWFGTECFVFNFEADPDPGNEDLLIFKQKNFKISLLLFFAIFMLKLDEPLRDKEFL